MKRTSESLKEILAARMTKEEKMALSDQLAEKDMLDWQVPKETIERNLRNIDKYIPQE